MNWRNSAEAHAERQLPRGDLEDHRDDIINRYVVGEESLREIASRYRASGDTIGNFLRKHGVTLREAGGRHHNSTAGRAAREERRARARLDSAAVYGVCDEADPAERADRRHLALIAQALSGLRFPVLPTGRVRA